MEQVHEYALKLLRYVLNKETFRFDNEPDYDELFEFGKKHGIEGLLYTGLRDLGIPVDEGILKKFKTAYEMQVVVETVQEYELKSVEDAFEQEGIDNIPLKGSVVKYLYPSPELRKSGDIDVLIKLSDDERVKAIIEGLGYHQGHPDDHEVHVSYVKPPFTEIEIHRRLTRLEDRSRRFCDKVWEHVSCKKGFKHCYEMEPEYLYVYLLAHLCKHIYVSGAGIRLVTDILVLKQKQKLDKKKIDKYLKEANLTDLNRMLLGLIDKWFYDISGNDGDVNALEKIVLTGGSFGSHETTGLLKGSVGEGRIILFFQRLFPPSEMMRGRYPQFQKKKYPWIYMWIYRMYDLTVNKRNVVKGRVEETFTNKHNNANSGEEYKNLAKAVRSKIW